MAKTGDTVDYSEIDAGFVVARRNALEDRWGERDRRMDDYEKAYLLDLWEEPPDKDEVRIVPPTAHETVERFRALFLSQPPVISVPASEVKGVEAERADLMEKYLIGVWYAGQVLYELGLTEWAASCLGEGVVRCVYDPGYCEDELPLLIKAVDPRTVYATPGARPLQDLEQIYVIERTRREVDAELAEDKGDLWEKALNKGGREGKELEDWLDEEVDYLEYWRLSVKEVEEEVEPVQEEQPAEEELGVFERLWLRAKEWAQKVGLVTPGAGQVQASVTTEAGGEPGAPLVDSAREEGGEPVEEVEEPEPKTRTVRRRVVVRAVVCDEQLIMKAAPVPGYNRLPFIRYPGLATLLEKENQALSVLFSVLGGTRENGARGVVGAEAEMLAMRQRLVRLVANSAMWTDDQSLDKVDWRPGALNYVKKDGELNFLVPPAPHPSVDQQMGLLSKYIEDGTLPAMMKGRYVGDASGLALSALSNPVLMMIAHRQQIREMAFQELNSLILSLTEEWAPADGWYVHGLDRLGQRFEARLRPDDIGGYRQNRVQLSASLPKDTAGEIMSLSQLQARGQISMETFLEEMQRIKRMSSQSPLDEIRRILRDKMMLDGPTTQVLARLILADYSEELAELLGALGGGAGAQVGPGGVPAAAGMGQGPMQGMPPSVVAPQAVPQAVGAGGAEALLRMLAMEQQQAPPGAGVGPVVPGRG